MVVSLEDISIFAHLSVPLSDSSLTTSIVHLLYTLAQSVSYAEACIPDRFERRWTDEKDRAQQIGRFVQIPTICGQTDIIHSDEIQAILRGQNSLVLA